MVNMSDLPNPQERFVDRSTRSVSFFNPVPKPQNYKGVRNTFLALGTVVMHVASCKYMDVLANRP